MKKCYGKFFWYKGITKSSKILQTAHLIHKSSSLKHKRYQKVKEEVRHITVCLKSRQNKISRKHFSVKNTKWAIRVKRQGCHHREKVVKSKYGSSLQDAKRNRQNGHINMIPRDTVPDLRYVEQKRLIKLFKWGS